MGTRDEYVAKMREAMGRLEVKASLAKLELQDVRDDLLTKYDAVRDKLQDLKGETEDGWQNAKDGVESAWHKFKRKFDETMAKHRKSDG